MRYITLPLLQVSFFLLSQNAFSQNLSLTDYERILKLNLFNSNTELNKLGLNYDGTQEKDSNNCQVIAWSTRDECKKTDCIFFLRKEFCENENYYTIIATFYNKSYYYKIRLQVENSGYQLRKSFADNEEMRFQFTNPYKRYLLEFSEKPTYIEGANETKVIYTLSIVGK